MELLLIISGVFLSVSAVAILLLSFYCGKPIKYLLLNALLGLSAVAVISLTSRFTGVTMHINPITVIGSAVFSVPAVIGFLLLNIILM